MKIKTFPLYFTEDTLEEIRLAAKKSGLTMKDFMVNAVMLEVEKANKKG